VRNGENENDEQAPTIEAKATHICRNTDVFTPVA